MTLLALGKPQYFDLWVKLESDRLFVALMIIITASFVIYSLQRYIWNELLIFGLDRLFGCAAFSRPRRNNAKRDRRWWHICGYCNRLSLEIIRRFGFREDGTEPNMQGFSDYLINRWAVTHSLGSNFWTFTFLWIWALWDKEASLLESWWVVLLALAILSLIGNILGAVLLHRVERWYFQRSPGRLLRLRWLGRNL